MNMNQIPNPFLTSNEVPYNAVASTRTPTSSTSPGFLLMTPPQNSGRCNYTRHSNTSNFNNSTSNNGSFSPWGSPTRFQNCRMSSPRNQSRGYSGNNNYSQRFSYRPQSSYQSTDNRNYSPSFHQSTPAGNCYGQGRNQSWRNNSPHKTSYQTSSQKTPLKEIPIEKFISRNVIEDPWNDFEEIVFSSNGNNDETIQSVVSSMLQSSSLAESQTNHSSDNKSHVHIVNNSVITNTESSKSPSGLGHV